LAWIWEEEMFVKGAATGGVAATALEKVPAHNEMARTGTRKREIPLNKRAILLIKPNEDYVTASQAKE